jgi:hypothetical protein
MLIVDYLLWILLDSYDHTRRQSCAGDCMHVICSRDPRISVRFAISRYRSFMDWRTQLS